MNPGQRTSRSSSSPSAVRNAGATVIPARQAGGMSGIVSRWPVLLHRSANSGSLDEDGAISSNVLGDWLVDLVGVVLAECPELQLELNEAGASPRLSEIAVTGSIRGAGRVTVGGGVTEVLPRSLTVAARFRAGEDTVDGVANGSCTVRFLTAEGTALQVSKTVRDAYVAAAHRASFLV